MLLAKSQTLSITDSFRVSISILSPRKIREDFARMLLLPREMKCILSLQRK